jgi:acyl-CoA reductase-like NAD-dependent aldehyde dehydrogenase
LEFAASFMWLCLQDAKKEGGQLLTGGKRPPGLDQGYFVQPTVFTGMKPHMRLWREEVFGPVLAAMTFKTEEEAVQLANASEFGLAGAVISADEQVGVVVQKQNKTTVSP